MVGGWLYNCRAAKMGATASVLAGAAMEPVKKVGGNVGQAIAVVKPSAQTQKLVKMYAKEGYRQVAHYTKRGLRTAATGFTIASTIVRKMDVGGRQQRQKDIEEREANRRKLLLAKKGIAEEDHGVVETETKGLILIEGDEDEADSDREDAEKEEEDHFADIFAAGAAQGEAETFYKESSADKLKKQMDRWRRHSEKLRLKSRPLND